MPATEKNALMRLTLLKLLDVSWKLDTILDLWHLKTFIVFQQVNNYGSTTQFSITTTQNLLFYTKSDREE